MGSRVLAYHVCFAMYGFWLPNDPRGSNSKYVGAKHLRQFGKATLVTDRRSHAGDRHDAALRAAAKRALRYPPVVMNGLQARAVARGFAIAIERSGAIVHACAIMIVWNLVRLTMAKFAEAVGASVWRISFLDTLRALCVLLQGERPTELQLLLNPDRPGRWEPRKLKRRIKQYDLLKEPRQNLKAKHRARYA